MANAVGLAMKITADTSSLQRGVEKTQETLDGFGSSTSDLKTIIQLLAKMTELLAMQLQEMRDATDATVQSLAQLTTESQYANTVLKDIDKSTRDLTGDVKDLTAAVAAAAATYSTLTKKNLLFNTAVGASSGGMGFFTKTILKSAAVRVLGLTSGVAALTTGLYGIGVAAAAAAPGLKSLETFTERIGIEAAKLGTSFQFVQTLEVAASRSGESIDSLRVGFTALLRNIEAARDGAAGTTAAFEKLGISTQDIESLSPEQIFKKVAVNLEGIEDPATRSAAALAVLGENGARLQPALRSIADAEADVKRFSAELDRLDVARLADMGEGFDDLQTAFSGLGRQLVLPFAGLVEGVTKAFADVIGGVTAIIAPLGDVLGPVLDLLGLLIQAVGGLTGVVLKLIGAALEPVAFAFRLGGEAIEYVSGALDYLFKEINSGIDYFRSLFGLPAFETIGEGAEQATASIEEATTASQEFSDEISRAAETASEFGQAGFDAAMKYQEALEEINLLKQEGEYTEEQANEAAKRANETFEERIELLRQQVEEQKKAAEQAERAAKADQQRISKFRESGMSSEEKEREEAAETVLAIQREQARVERQIAEARAHRDNASLNAAQARLSQLEKEEARAADIASGAAAAREKEKKEEEERQRERAREQEERVRAIMKHNEDIANKREELNKVGAEMEQERLDALAANTNKALQASDIRSGGIASVIALATGREDPAVQEARKQVRKLEEIKAELRALGNTVEIVGAV